MKNKTFEGDDEMKAFEVMFSGPGYSGYREIVLVETENDIEVALQEKSMQKFIVGNPYCVIGSSREIPLSKVKIADLSVTEFLTLTIR